MKKMAHQPQLQPNMMENPMQMMQQMMGMFMGGLAGSMALAHSPDKITPGPPLADQDITPSTGLKRAADSEPLPQNVDIEVWLSQLDTDPIHGNRNINYSQFSSSLSSTGIYELSDLAILETSVLLKLVDGLNYGIANCLIMYVREDYPASKCIRLN